MTNRFLSSEGRRRKAEMCGQLKGAVVSRRRRRRAIRAGVGLALLGVVAFLARPREERPQHPDNVVVVPTPKFDHLELERVEGDVDRVSKWVVRDRDASRFYVDDDSLADLLLESGREPGFMRVGEEVALMVPLSPATDQNPER